MINRLISNLPFNPALVEELSLQDKRLRKERSIRLLGFTVLILSLLVQVLAANVHTEKSLNSSDNDVILGGVRTKQDILNAWDDPGTHVADIYSKFGINRQDIADIHGNKPNARIQSDASNFWSAGRSPLTGYASTSHTDEEIAISTAGPTVFLRPLRAWDTGGKSSAYDAFMGHNSGTGETFWILASSGNYTQNGTGKLPAPNLQLNQTIVNGTGSVKPGDLIMFRIEYRNSRQDSLAEDVKIIDNLQEEKIDIVSPGNLSISPHNKAVEDVGNLRYTENSRILDLTVRAKNNLRTGTKVCNSVKLVSSNATTGSSDSSQESCVRISRTTNPSLDIAVASSTPSSSQTMVASPEIMPPGTSEQVRNITQGLDSERTLSSKVRPGDILEYTLVTYNAGNQPVTGYAVKDFIGDITDYADVDTSLLSGQGGVYDKQNKEVVWRNQQINPLQSISRRFRVRIKNPVPATNKPSLNSTNFDCKISNEYGNEITMEVPCPVAKLLDSLPNTGAGPAILITFALVCFSGYFLARNALLGKEVSVLRKYYTSTGGNK